MNDSIMMKALFFQDQLEMREIPIPRPGPGEALIKIRMAGICNTDMEIIQGYMNFHGVLGHEFVGEVVECEDSGWLGKRVVGEINAGCGECETCHRGLQRHCARRSVLGIQGRHGVFAEYATLPVANLLAVPEWLPDEEAVFTEPLAAACEILEQVHIDPSWEIAVLGDGKLAQLVVRVLHLTGARLTMVGKHPEKWVGLKTLPGVSCRLRGQNEARYDLVVEATGHPSGFYDALESVKPRGILVLKSTTHESIDFNPAPLVIHEIELVGSRCGPFRPALNLLEKKVIDVLPLISRIIPFSDWPRAMEQASLSANCKILLSMI